MSFSNMKTLFSEIDFKEMIIFSISDHAVPEVEDFF